MNRLIDLVMGSDLVKETIMEHLCPDQFGFKNHPNCYQECLCEECWNRYEHEPYFPSGIEKD